MSTAHPNDDRTTAARGDAVPTAVVVEHRTTVRHVEALGLTCEKEGPVLFTNGMRHDNWLGMGRFIGYPTVLTADGQLGTVADVSAVGLVDLGIQDGRLFGVVAPEDATSPAVWIAARLTDLEITTRGTAGLFKKRPEHILFSHEDWALSIGYVQRMSHKSDMRIHAQEGALLEALRG